MLISNGTQTQVNITNSMDELQIGTYRAPSGVMYSAYYQANFSVDDPTFVPAVVYVRALDAAGNPTGAEIILTVPPNFYANRDDTEIKFQVLGNGNFLLLVEQNEAFNGSGIPNTAIYGQIYSPSGATVGSTIIINASSGYSNLREITPYPTFGGFVVGYDVGGANGQTFKAYDASGNFIVNADSSIINLTETGIIGFVDNVPIWAGYLDGNFNNPVIHFPNQSSVVNYGQLLPSAPSGQQYIFTESKFIKESDTSVVIAYERELVSFSTFEVFSRSIEIVRFVSGTTTGTLLSSIALPATGEIEDQLLTDFIKLSDGSFVMALQYAPDPPASPGVIPYPETELRHISASGQPLGSAVQLNTAGTGEGVPSLLQLANGNVLVTYTGRTSATGTDGEVFREIFTVTAPSSVPSAGDDIINGTAGNDVIDSLGGNDTINGLAGDDTLTGGEGVDTLNGGDNNDTLTGGNGADTLNGNAGNDIINFFANDTANGGDGDDTLILTGGAYGGNWNGGLGFDIADFRNATTAAFQLGGVTFISTERGLGTAFDDHFLAQNGTGATAGKEFFGFAGNDILTGADFNDILDGGTGNDILNGGIGYDTLRGGLGDDTYVISDNLDTIVELSNQGTDTIISSTYFSQLDVGNNIENIAYNGTGDSILYGNSLGNVLTGSNGSDSLNGFFGVDIYYGGNGNDYIYIDEQDYLNGGDGTDAVFIQTSVGVTLNLGASFVEYVLGYTGNDILNGSTSSVSVTLFGGAGADQLQGGSANDFLYIDAADTLVNAGGGTNDVIVVYNETNGVNLNITAANAEYVIGGGGSDILNAAGSVNTVAIQGGAGADIITGGNANDYFYGNAGADIFRVTANAQFDAVFDFVDTGGVEDDRIDVRALGASFDTLAEVLAATTEYSGTSVVNFGGGNQLYLYQVLKANLNSDDFIFV